MKDFFILGQTGVSAAKQAAPAAATAKTAQPAKVVQHQPSFMEGLGGMLPFILIIGAMFFLMWRGQSKERKRREELLASMKAGDKIVTAGGIYGVIDSVKENTFRIRIADNVCIEVSRAAISGKVEPEQKAEAAKK